MRYLLDTHVALWLFEGNEKLPRIARDIIFGAENEIYVNIVSVLEVAIKVSEALNKAYLDEQAGILASELQDGQPCSAPCGFSIEPKRTTSWTRYCL